MSGMWGSDQRQTRHRYRYTWIDLPDNIHEILF